MSDPLVAAAARLSMTAAVQYCQRNGLDAKSRLDALLANLKVETAKGFREGMADARLALEANMGAVAETTFAASLMNAGVRAAKRTFEVAP